MNTADFVKRHGGKAAIRAKHKARNADEKVRIGRAKALGWLSRQWADIHRRERPDPRS